MERFQQALVEQAEGKSVQEYEGVRNRYKKEVNDLLPEGQRWEDIKERTGRYVYKEFKVSADG
ncbi:MAG: hypothetical protein U5J63_13265 [Fodinibius sp.]|nr:hypothetical protein [Fodinibius sp.]